MAVLASLLFSTPSSMTSYGISLASYKKLATAVSLSWIYRRSLTPPFKALPAVHLISVLPSPTMNDRHSASSASSSSNQGGGGAARQSAHPTNPHSSSTSPNTIAALVHHQPVTAGEWQLFVVLQRANLLQYYETFISQGGDDVQQLLEAGEEEFLEIMALVGMASKPLHVRRLQKSLQEFSMNPAAFQLLAMQKSAAAAVALPPIGQPAAMLAASPHMAMGSVPPPSGHPTPPGLLHVRPTSAHSVHPPGSMSGGGGGGCGHPPPPGSLGGAMGVSATAPISIVSSESPGATSVQSNGSSNLWPSPRAEAFDLGLTDQYGITPTLTEPQVQRLAECAITILRRQAPDIEQPKTISQNNRRKISRELLAVMELSMESPYRLDEFRRFAAIYGRFDAKRKADKPLTLHEVSVNEAAAQVCLHRPVLLTRRDELFPLARLVVKEAGFNYMKTGRSKSEQDDTFSECNLSTGHPKRPAQSDSVSGADEGDASGGGSPAPSTSSASQASPGIGGGGGGALTISLSPPLAADSSSSSSMTTTPSKRQKRRLDEIGMELQRVSAEQEACKRRVNGAQEMGEVISIQHDLNRLTQRQLELSDEEASLKTTTVNGGDEYHMLAVNGQQQQQRAVTQRLPNGSHPYPPHPLSDLSRSINAMGYADDHSRSFEAAN